MAYQFNDSNEPSVDFRWEDIEPTTEDSDCIEQYKHLLLFLSSFIFLPHPKGGKRKDRQQVISAKSLAVFSVLLQSHLGANPTSLLRASGLGISARNFNKHLHSFKSYIEKEGNKKAMEQLLTKERN